MCERPEATTLRSAEILCIIGSGMGDTTVDRLLDVMHSASFDLNPFWGAMQWHRDCRELA